MHVELVGQTVFHLLSLKIHVPLYVTLLHLYFSFYLKMAASLQYGKKPLLQQFIKREITLFLKIIGLSH